HSSPQVVLLAVDFHKDFIDVAGIAVASVLSFQPAGVQRAELDTPEPDCFAADCNASFSEKVSISRWLRLKR
ncbi:MAG: hypothetical protein WBM41_19010, partial [Arenicellales bacterium]